MTADTGIEIDARRIDTKNAFRTHLYFWFNKYAHIRIKK